MATTNNEYFRTKFYKVYRNRKGEKVLQTKNSALARALMFATEEYCMKFNNEDGSKTFSFTWSQRLQDIADQIIAWHEESMDVKKSAERTE